MKKYYFIIMKKKVLLRASISAIIFVVSAFFIYSAFFPGYDGIGEYVINYTDSEPIEMTSKTVYLTFDDGPSKYTPEVLDILDDYNVPATFFVVGTTEYTSLMKDIVERGHIIGLHSYNHKFEQIYRSSDAFFDDLKAIDDIVFNETGIRSKITRFPGGSSVRRGATKSIMRQLCVEVQEKGYQYFDWNCESNDKVGVKTVYGALAKTKKTAKEAGDIVIVLMHDTEKVAVNALPSIIEYFKEEGFEFSTLSSASPAVHHSW